VSRNLADAPSASAAIRRAFLDAQYIHVLPRTRQLIKEEEKEKKNESTGNSSVHFQVD
jgi:hypothetical protein